MIWRKDRCAVLLLMNKDDRHHDISDDNEKDGKNMSKNIRLTKQT